MIWTILLELLLAVGALFVGLLGSIIGVGLLGDGNYTLVSVILFLPLCGVGLVNALLYVFLRRRYRRPLTFSLGTALAGALLITVVFSIIGTFTDSWESFGYLLAFALPTPLLHGLLSGGVATARQR